jgi:tRNA(Ile)-lysidine synthase
MADSPTPRIAEADLGERVGGCVAVAFSGGLDSTALLLATARQARPLGLRVVALHVHHGLMAEADAWVEHVTRVCAQFEVPLRITRLKGRPAKGDSVEAWARRGRYQALAAMAQSEQVSLILLAQHAEDQAETVLLQALRGAGPAGLAAMPQTWTEAGITWARPWLQQPRRALQALVRAAGLAVVEDPSNVDPRYARSRLRRGVWPALVQAFPNAATVLAEVARHAAQAKALAEEVAQLDLPSCLDGQQRLRFAAWQALPPARRRNAMAAWLALQMPDVPVSLVDRLSAEWLGQGARWPAPNGWLLAQRKLLRFETSPAAK